MKAALMAEPDELGNDEPWNRIVRQTIRRHQRRRRSLKQVAEDRNKMTISARSNSFFADFRNAHALRWIFVAAVLAAVAVRISVGLSVANGSGRLVGNSGTGRWSGVISGDRCSGSWEATRS
jgi:hypothetical protein